jgi:hypothetical protein
MIKRNHKKAEPIGIGSLINVLIGKLNNNGKSKIGLIENIKI